MHLNTLVLFGLLLPVLGQSTYSKSVCHTNYGKKSVKPPLPTKSTTRAFTFTALRMTVVMPSVTITPKPKTTTAVVDSTSTITSSVPRETDYFVEFITHDETLTFWETTTAIETQIDTTTLTLEATVTRPTKPGYVPIQSGGIYLDNFKKRTEGRARRIAEAAVTSAPAIEARQKKNEQVELCGIRDGKPYVPGKYPNSVVCENNIKVVTTKTISFKWFKTVTRTAPQPTITSTSTRIHTITTVVTPVRASTTYTSHYTHTWGTTLTSTIPSTTTIVATATVSNPATSTIVAACHAPEDFLGFNNGTSIANFVVKPGDEISLDGYDSTTKESCCTYCQDRDNCFLSEWLPSGQCFLWIGVNSFQCNPARIVLGYNLAPFPIEIPSQIFSNGPCGRIAWRSGP